MVIKRPGGECRWAPALLENSLLQLNLVIAQFPGSCNKWPAFYGVNKILCEGKYRDHEVETYHILMEKIKYFATPFTHEPKKFD